MTVLVSVCVSNRSETEGHMVVWTRDEECSF